MAIPKEIETAKSVTMSLYQEHMDIVQKHKDANRFKSDAASLQNILTTFRYGKKIEIYKNIIILLIYPVILCTFSLYGGMSLQKTIGKLVDKGYTDLGHLVNLEAIYGAFGFITLGFLAMCVMFLIAILKKHNRLV